MVIRYCCCLGETDEMSLRCYVDAILPKIFQSSLQGDSSVGFCLFSFKSLNLLLPGTCQLCGITLVETGFHARYSDLLVVSSSNYRKTTSLNIIDCVIYHLTTLEGI